MSEPLSDSNTGPSLEIKAGMFTIMVLHPLCNDLDSIAAKLGLKIKQAPKFFDKAPLVIDLQEVRDEFEAADLLRLLDLLQGYDLVPVGIRGGSDAHRDAARQFGLGVFAAASPEGEQAKVSRLERRRRGSAEPAEAANTTAPPETAHEEPEPAADIEPGSSTRCITHPIRSGQQVYARGADLIVMGTVSPGAEIIADGNIHVYGALRGKALAGAQGDIHARIFCQRMEAELVSIAGQYRIIENFEEGLRGQPAQIRLEDNRLRIESL